MLAIILGNTAYSYDDDDSQDDDAAEHYAHDSTCAQRTCSREEREKSARSVSQNGQEER